MAINVYFGTNRDPKPAGKPTNFGSRFGPDGIANLRFGRAEVEGKKVTIKVADERLSAPGEKQAPVLGSQSVFEGLRELMSKNQRDTVLFIHGYNVDFKEAMISAARLERNFAPLGGGRGVNVAAFSWPSDGSLTPWLAYSSDRRDAAASGPAFARGLLKLRDFLVSIPREKDCERKIHLVAHSMGNYVLRHAFQELLRQTAGSPPRIFDQIFLMAADEDDDTFEHDHKMRQLPRIGRRVNVYFNREDRAMSISDRTKGNPSRLGDDGPRSPFLVPAKVTQIDCTRVVSGLVEHSYFLDTAPVIEDMMRTIEGLEPQDVPGRRFVPDRNRFEIAG
ncbi:MAG: alpha/beta fold hydrolase [Planctomycetes bacterium]|nr:alpha/beta fold hydrolase [Planctomycetota bacterium]